MNYISKLLWSFISTMICIVYKADGAGCSYRLLASQYLGAATGDFSQDGLCSASTLCAGNEAPGHNNCATRWIRQHYRVAEPEFSETQVCAKNSYILNCRVGDTLISNSDQFDRCHGGFTCRACPSGPGGALTTGSSIKRSQTGANWENQTIVFLCSSKNAAGTNLGGLYMMKYEIISCPSAYSSTLNGITDCYVKSNIMTNDGTGSYIFTNSCHYSTI